MNILLITMGAQSWGGIESYLDVLASILLEKGDNVTMSCDTDGYLPLRSADVTLETIKIRIKSSIDVSAILKIVRESQKRNIDLIMAHHGKHYWPAVVAAKILRVPVLFVRHQAVRLKKTTCWMINRSVDKVIAVSNAVKESLLRAGVSDDKIIVFHNCVALKRFDPLRIDACEVRRELGIGENDFVVGTAGKLHRDKGVYDLLYGVKILVAKYPSIKVLFVGSGPERHGLERESQKLSIHKNVIFAGVRTDMERMYAAMDLSVLPSTCVEGFGMALIEAMAMKKPVIGSSIGGITEIISHNVNGILIPPGDVAALAEAIAGSIENKEVFRNIALEGRKTVELKFSGKIYGDKLRELIETLK